MSDFQMDYKGLLYLHPLPNSIMRSQGFSICFLTRQALRDRVRVKVRVRARFRIKIRIRVRVKVMIRV